MAFFWQLFLAILKVRGKNQGNFCKQFNHAFNLKCFYQIPLTWWKTYSALLNRALYFSQKVHSYSILYFREAIHTGNLQFGSQSGQVYYSMLDVFMKSERETVEFLLERYPVSVQFESAIFFWLSFDEWTKYYLFWFTYFSRFWFMMAILIWFVTMLVLRKWLMLWKTGLERINIIQPHKTFGT